MRSIHMARTARHGGPDPVLAMCMFRMHTRAADPSQALSGEGGRAAVPGRKRLEAAKLPGNQPADFQGRFYAILT
eukprot:NODE_501_length_2028_cov_10.878221_g396_i0.p5 GENE.NODE_501_length_2028_cov_10.878221_g396_i0~~NODE_501_length_2028_cov_10.878221_g396_i0.p5  ORF type:complete len:75 (-),score=10.29 NODE_501_length_2028_cov_10.878221_g396_i0:589-813(-)